VSRAPLLIEIGCEEIPARMIEVATAELARRVVEILERAEIEHGSAAAWGGPRRLVVRVEQVAGRQPDREQLVLGPSLAAGRDAAGRPTPAAVGFARKHGVEAESLAVVESEKGPYLALRGRRAGRGLGEILAETFAPAVEAMPFPKTMRWGDGSRRWVRPVHWLLVLHGAEVLPLRLFGIDAGRSTVGHRRRGAPAVRIDDPDRHAPALDAAGVVVDPRARRERLVLGLARAAGDLGGSPVDDPLLIDEVVGLVEWPAVVAGRFDAAFLELPRELLVTSLRHHQKCFSVQDARGSLIAGFLAVADGDGDPAGHVRRGNEWVVAGRLEDARFFWGEDGARTLESRLGALDGVVFHARCGSYGDKARRLEQLGTRLAAELGLEREMVAAVGRACRLAKADLVTGLVGEFPELQGVVGGLLLAREGDDPTVARAVYEHYRPAGSTDAIPGTIAGSVVALADRLDTVAQLVAAGEQPTGSRDPLGLRRATNGIFRIVLERGFRLSLGGLADLPHPRQAAAPFLEERLRGFLRDAGYSMNEILATFRPGVDDGAAATPDLPDVKARLDAIRQVRGRDDFRHLVKLTERVDSILTKNSAAFQQLLDQGVVPSDDEPAAAARELEQLLERQHAAIAAQSAQRHYAEVIAGLAAFIQPVERFFRDVLVLDPHNPAATLRRQALLARLRAVLTRHFDIRELAGQAEGRIAS